MALSQRFRVNRPRVISESFDNEVVVVDLKAGCYYSLDKVGHDVWNLVESGTSVSEAVVRISQRYSAPYATVEDSVTKLIAQLQQEGLILPALADEGTGCPALKAEPQDVVSVSDRPFEAPVLQKYTDMQDLLMLDPIHEVDETGWPHRKAGS